MKKEIYSLKRKTNFFSNSQLVEFKLLSQLTKEVRQQNMERRIYELWKIHEKQPFIPRFVHQHLIENLQHQNAFPWITWDFFERIIFIQRYLIYSFSEICKWLFAWKDVIIRSTNTQYFAIAIFHLFYKNILELFLK